MSFGFFMLFVVDPFALLVRLFPVCVATTSTWPYSLPTSFSPIPIK